MVGAFLARPPCRARGYLWLPAQGMLVASIGEGPFNGELRMSSHDYPYLVDGLKLVIVGLGIFAIPRKLSPLLRKDPAIADRPVLGSGWCRGSATGGKTNGCRCTLCCDRRCCRRYSRAWRFYVGDWIAYGHTVRSDKGRNQTSGSGENPRTVSSGLKVQNNAKEGGGLVPTLLFGIPGSGSMAIFNRCAGTAGFR